MPPIETDERNQLAVYWAKTSMVSDYSDLNYSTPIELKVRWESGRKETIDAQGNPQSYDAMLVLDRAVKVGDRFWLGTLDEWNDGNSDNPTYVMQVLFYNEVPDVKGREIRRTAGLMRANDTVPA